MHVNTTHSPLILNNQLVEDGFIDPVDENRNHKSPQDETASEKINCTMCAVIIPNYIPDYFHGIEINPDCQNCSPKDLITYKQSPFHHPLHKQLQKQPGQNAQKSQ